MDHPNQRKRLREMQTLEGAEALIFWLNHKVPEKQPAGWEFSHRRLQDGCYVIYGKHIPSPPR